MKAKPTVRQKHKKPDGSMGWRHNFVVMLLAGLGLVLVGRLVQLHILDEEFLAQEGNKRTLRNEVISAHRGQILDRNGQVLAISTPVASIWFNPKHLEITLAQKKQLAKLLNLSLGQLDAKLKVNDRGFVYLKRRISPQSAQRILSLEIPGIKSQREYKRYYPASEVAAHVVGFTDVDDKGLEGIELALDDWLTGKDGKRKVLKDRRGLIVKDLGIEQAALAGKNVELSIDLRLQYMAYRELQKAVNEQGASSGSVVMLDAKSGEILALVNQPSYNPNNRSQLKPEYVRNRAITDLYEPGSTVKPLTVASALQQGAVVPETKLDTAPGYMKIGDFTIPDTRNYGELDITGIIRKSSNVGAIKLAQATGGKSMWETFYKAGFGASTGTGFPGEGNGKLPAYNQWRGITLATMSYGYGLATTPLQIAQAYLPFANQGNRIPVSLLKKEKVDQVINVIDADTAATVLAMMESVIQEGGTGTRAAVKGYRVAGKTGTVHKVGDSGYDDSRYVSGFAGIAPLSNPRIITVVLIDDPKGEEYYGGEIAAPVFSKLVSESMRIMNVSPDQIADYKSIDTLLDTGLDTGEKELADTTIEMFISEQGLSNQASQGGPN